MRILLINPPKSSRESYGVYSTAAPVLPPLGLCYLASTLLEDRHKIKIVDAVAGKLTFKEIKDMITEYAPKIVGLTSTTISYKSACKVIDITKEINDNIVTILGGAHVSANPYETMKECKNLDITVVNEGEHTIKELVRNIEQNGNMTLIKGIYYRENGDIIKNSPRALENNIDIFPFPNRELLNDLRLYSHVPMRGPRKLTTTMITSRGCPYHCSFCQQSIFGRTWRGHSPDYVVGEIKTLIEKYKVQFISIEDDNFAFDRNRVIKICYKMINDRFRVEWGCSININDLDGELLKIMRYAGCKNIYIGIESASSRMLRLYQKNERLDKLINTINLIKKVGLNVYGAFILGAPTESKKELGETIKFAITLPLDGVSFSLYVPYPNTKLRYLAFRSGIVSKNWDDYSAHPNNPSFINNGFTAKKILKIQKRAYLRFYFRCGYIVRHLKFIFRTNFIFKAFNVLIKLSFLK